MPDALIEDLDRSRRVPLRINGHDPTFRLATDRISASALAPLDPAIEDLLHIASAVFVADGTIPRGGATRPNMGASWRRNLRITLGVRQRDIWEDAGVRQTLTDVVEFLTEDRIDFRFLQADAPGTAQGFLDLDPEGAAFHAEEVILFSGGLDSFAGALEALSTGRHNVLLVSHRSAQKVLPRQDVLAGYLLERFPQRLRHVRVIARRLGAEAAETTQRSRSLLFAALGQAVAKTFGAARLSFYENGIVSHNLPIGPQVVGTMATRTTHPLALLMLNRLMERVVPDAVLLANPYEWLTKTEVVQRIAQHGGETRIRHAVSCTSVRDQTRQHPHCGACSQCLDRRFGILAAGLGEHDPPEQYRTDVLLDARDDEHALKMAVEWTRHALHLRGLDANRFLASFGLELSRILQGHPELAVQAALDRVLALHHRHAGAVLKVLEAAIVANATALAEHRLPPSSLLMLHLGADPHADRSRLPSDPRMSERPPRIPDEIAPEDLRPDPMAPLEVAFFQEGERRVVAVTGLARIEGAPARIPHALKPVFDEDRGNGRAPEEHRYVHVHLQPATPMSKENARKNVARCRTQLAESYRQIFGIAPRAPLLIQNRPRVGYRLDPTIRITTHGG